MSASTRWKSRPRSPPIRSTVCSCAIGWFSLYESRKDFQSAQHNVEALYRENPKILGVVRSTVDFYWRIKSYPQAIAVLLQASKDAYPELGKQFTFEAARKSTEAGQYPQARDLLTQLLNASPYDGQYLAAMADTYAQAGDDRGLRQFYLDKIALFRSAPFSGDERKTRIATLRRGLIPALTRMKDYAGAVDQYIELINNFPEDAGLVTEAALYALRYQRQQQLLDFYSKTVTQSPRDYRWPMVLAEIQTSFEQYPAAIESYCQGRCRSARSRGFAMCPAPASKNASCGSTTQPPNTSASINSPSKIRSGWKKSRKFGPARDAPTTWSQP